MANVTQRLCQAATNDDSAGLVEWQNPGDAPLSDADLTASGNNAALAPLDPGQDTQWLKCTTFKLGEGVDAIPAGATIVGIQVRAVCNEVNNGPDNNEFQF